MGLGILREAKVKTDEALAAGIMNGASRSLAARVEEHKENHRRTFKQPKIHVLYIFLFFPTFLSVLMSSNHFDVVADLDEIKSLNSSSIKLSN